LPLLLFYYAVVSAVRFQPTLSTTYADGLDRHAERPRGRRQGPAGPGERVGGRSAKRRGRRRPPLPRGASRRRPPLSRKSRRGSGLQRRQRPDSCRCEHGCPAAAASETRSGRRRRRRHHGGGGGGGVPREGNAAAPSSEEESRRYHCWKGTAACFALSVSVLPCRLLLVVCMQLLLLLLLIG
jgi:hypothetical protein